MRILRPPAGYEDWQDIMQLALKEARGAARQGEVPVGAVLLGPNGDILAKAGNGPVAYNDPTAHAEILVLRQGAEKLGNYRLKNCILVATLEPCLMCLGAMLHARIHGLVFGARDEKAGALISCLDGVDLSLATHRFPFVEGILAEESRALLQEFFQKKRVKKASLSL